MAAARAERKRAAQKRAAAKAGKVTVLPSQATSKPKPKTKALKKQADKLLATKKKKTADPNYKPQKASGYTRDERHRLRRAARRLMKDINLEKISLHHLMTLELRTLEEILELYIQMRVCQVKIKNN